MKWCSGTAAVLEMGLEWKTRGEGQHNVRYFWRNAIFEFARVQMWHVCVSTQPSSAGVEGPRRRFFGQGASTALFSSSQIRAAPPIKRSKLIILAGATATNVVLKAALRPTAHCYL